VREDIAKLERLADDNLELALDLASLSATARKFRVADESDQVDSTLSIEMLGGYVEPLDLAGSLEPRDLVIQTAERLAESLEEWIRPLRDLVVALRKVGDPRLEPFIERCAALVRRTIRDSGV
jgi:hypothetical protein